MQKLLRTEGGTEVCKNTECSSLHRKAPSLRVASSMLKAKLLVELNFMSCSQQEFQYNHLGTKIHRH